MEIFIALVFVWLVFLFVKSQSKSKPSKPAASNTQSRRTEVDRRDRELARALSSDLDDGSATSAGRERRGTSARDQRRVQKEAAADSLGIQFRDGRYHYRGYGFTSREQAEAFARRSAADDVRSARPTRTESETAVRRAPTAGPPPRWVPSTESVEIASLPIGGGLIYVGTPSGSDGWHAENCLIDPILPVAAAAGDPEGSELGYWCSYRAIRPDQRRSYLTWLADGRRDPNAGIGYVFLYFYGLERRLFFEQAKLDGDLVVGEVERLLAIYGANASFRSYAQGLLLAAQTFGRGDVKRPPPSPDLRNGYEIPIHVRCWLGSVLKAGRPLDADDALLWLLGLPDTFLRTPGVRCFDELVALWRLRFARKYSSGVPVKAPKARIRSSYRAASGRFTIDGKLADLPDIAAITAPLSGLRDLLNACVDELDAYSRLLGRKPEARGSLEATLLLPEDLTPPASDDGVGALVRSLEAQTDARGLTGIGAAKLFELLGLESGAGKVSAAAHRQLAGLLDRLGFGFEPDRRYGSGALSYDGTLMLFKAEAGGGVDSDRPVYGAARTMIEIAALAATADGAVSETEFDAIVADLAALDLRIEEQQRLVALTGYLLSDPPRQSAALNRLAQLETPERQRVAQSAIGAVLADGHVRPEEVRFLEKLHKTLGLPQDAVYAALHRGSVVIDEPVTVASEIRATGVPIPPEPSASSTPSTSIVIDPERLARIRSETSEVSALLAGIFTEEEPILVAAPPPAAPASGANALPGLDGPHSALLQAILANGALHRSDFDAQARDLRLLPAGAFETINEWAFEQFDEPILEGEEAVVMAGHLRDRVANMGHAS